MDTSWSTESADSNIERVIRVTCVCAEACNSTGVARAGSGGYAAAVVAASSGGGSGGNGGGGGGGGSVLGTSKFD